MPNNEMNIQINERLKSLLKRDYKIEMIENIDKSICPTYPDIIFIIQSENSKEKKNGVNGDLEENIQENKYNVSKLKELLQKSNLARARQRAPVPVIYIDGKNISRSATLSQKMEQIYRQTQSSFYSKVSSYMSKGEEGLPNQPPAFDTSIDLEIEEEEIIEEGEISPSIVSKNRQEDIKLLKELGIYFIIDLMVEKKKTFYGLPVASSEKNDSLNRYKDFNVNSMPYPGCEFFKVWIDKNQDGKNLYFDWESEKVSARLDLKFDCGVLKLNWKDYKSWNLITLTQNYLLSFLSLIARPNSDQSLLVHCISGWDRTPLFISLLRLSLWADGLIHNSLNEEEILFFTVAYDWVFFNHNVNDRMRKGEEILRFSFCFLEYITDNSFSYLFLSNLYIQEKESSFFESDGGDNSWLLVDTPNTEIPCLNNKMSSRNNSRDNSLNTDNDKRKERLLKVKDLFLKYFDSYFLPSFEEISKKKSGWNNLFGLI
eukprot:TRINITY_DN5964_c0_g1_i1.p1 TRINITY_DN5964_c0_g1~~TRINITY_DN5964_c0_g1_i1.p1  ORF type:complete len:486 (-),score=146.47 TRINITY_DN5964_c0_g1_i1:114-1571(-)